MYTVAGKQEYSCKDTIATVSLASPSKQEKKSFSHTQQLMFCVLAFRVYTDELCGLHSHPISLLLTSTCGAI
jgi:hypothetical protein